MYIYLIRPREFIRTMENVYKIGKTTVRPTRRLGSYPKGSEIWLVMRVDDCHSMEKTIISEFKRTFIWKPEYGLEYFEGSPQKMIWKILSMAPGNPSSFGL